MKKLVLLICVAITLIASSCADSKTINGVTYRPYGFFNESSCKNDSVHYEVSGWAVCSGVIFFEMVVPPIYTFGFNLYEPVGLERDYKGSTNKGIVN